MLAREKAREEHPELKDEDICIALFPLVRRRSVMSITVLQEEKAMSMWWFRSAMCIFPAWRHEKGENADTGIPFGNDRD